MTKIKSGSVCIAGAGPGDHELITLKACKRLSEAEVIITDRLAADEIITHYANPKAKVIRVGKQGRNPASATQQQICELMVSHALKGARVLRLKGGDISVYAGLSDELEALIANGIPFELIPGISAVSAAAAFSAIPLTAKDVSSSFRILSIYNEQQLKAQDWKQLAQTTDTLVLYMSTHQLASIVKCLQQAGMRPDMPLAVIEQISTPLQRTRIFSVSTVSNTIENDPVQAPALIIIGPVAKLHHAFAWRPESITKASFFETLGQLSHA
jgi:uroporphyrin-III C-methyltransferase